MLFFCNFLHSMIVLSAPWDVRKLDFPNVRGTIWLIKKVKDIKKKQVVFGFYSHIRKRKYHHYAPFPLSLCYKMCLLSFFVRNHMCCCSIRLLKWHWHWKWATFSALRCPIWLIWSRNTSTWYEMWSSLAVRLLLGRAPTTWELFRYAWLTFPLHKIHIHLFACSTWTYHVIELPPRC